MDKINKSLAFRPLAGCNVFLRLGYLPNNLAHKTTVIIKGSHGDRHFETAAEEDLKVYKKDFQTIFKILITDSVSKEEKMEAGGKEEKT